MKQNLYLYFTLLMETSTCAQSLKVIECLLHHTANELQVGSSIYILNHYTAGVILFGKTDEVRRNSLSKVTTVYTVSW